MPDGRHPSRHGEPSAPDLLARYDGPEYRPGWDEDPAGPRLYRWFAPRLVGEFERHAAGRQRTGFADPNPLRVGLHASPVFRLGPDPVPGRTSVSGRGVNRTARVEPIAVPGSAYAGEQFAAVLTVAAADQFGSEFVGAEPSAKGDATAPLYRLGRGPDVGPERDR